MASTSDIAWHKCVLCQTETNEQLRCPFNMTVKDNLKVVVRELYESVASAIQRFNEGGVLPFNVHGNLIGDSEVITELFINQRAMWHKLCKNKLNNYKYERALSRKRKSSASTDIPKLRVSTVEMLQHKYLTIVFSAIVLKVICTKYGHLEQIER